MYINNADTTLLQTDLNYRQTSIKEGLRYVDCLNLIIINYENAIVGTGYVGLVKCLFSK